MKIFDNTSETIVWLTVNAEFMNSSVCYIVPESDFSYSSVIMSGFKAPRWWKPKYSLCDLRMILQPHCGEVYIFIQSMSALHGQMEKGFIGQAVVTVNRAGSNIMCQIAAQKVLHREGQFSFSKSSLRWCLADWHSCLSEHPQFMHISVLDRIYIIITSSKPHWILPSFVFLNICFIYLFI